VETRVSTLDQGHTQPCLANYNYLVLHIH